MTMLTTGLMTLIPAATSTTLALGPLAALALFGVVATGAVLLGGTIAEVRREAVGPAREVNPPASLRYAA
jgi:hypothetical protein